MSASPETGVTTGTNKPGPVAGPAGEVGAAGETVAATSWASDETELVRLPSRDEESDPESADAAVDESVSQETAAAPARITGRRARHGELVRAIRTTPQ